MRMLTNYLLNFILKYMYTSLIIKIDSFQMEVYAFYL